MQMSSWCVDVDVDVEMDVGVHGDANLDMDEEIKNMCVLLASP